MKKANFKENYEAPNVEIIEVEVEQGFAASGSGTGEDGSWKSPDRDNFAPEW